MASERQIVFLDVGNILIDDDPFLVEGLRFIYQSMPADHPKVQMERFLGDVERALRFNGAQAVERMGRRCLGRGWPRTRKQIQQHITKTWWGLVRMIPGARSALEEMRREFRLGIIANQPPLVIECLERWELLSLFDVVLLDSQDGVSKPDPAIFRIAMERARVEAGGCVMVGDRVDNDIIPARRLGMRAVLLWLGATEKGWEPADDWGARMWGVLERIPMPRWDNIPPGERPMAVARRWEHLPGALQIAWSATP